MRIKAIVLTLCALALAAAPARAVEPVRLGAVLSVTGPASFLGEPEKNTIQMEVDKINAAGGVLGRPLEVIILDDETDVNKAVLAVDRLIKKEHVSAILGPTTSGNTLAVMTGRHGLTGYSTLASLFRTPGFRRAEHLCRQRALEKLDFVGLVDDRDIPAGDLPYGRQRLLEMARALAAEPKLLLLDEPAAGLNTRETATLGHVIRDIRDKLHVTVGLVEHDMDLVMGVSDQVTVLNFGRPLASGTPEEIQANPDVVRAYLGEDE